MTEPIRDQEYLKAEQQLEERMAQVYRAVDEKKRQLRANVDMSGEQRQEAFANWYKDVGQNLYDEAARFVATFDNLRHDLNRKVHEGTGERFGELVARAAELPDDRLDEALATAERTGQAGLAQACAEVALSRRRTGTFNTWAEKHPERAKAIERLNQLPETERIVSRATARATVPNGNLEGLEPTEEDYERAAIRSRAAEAERERVLRAPKITRRVGSRVTEVPNL